VAIAGNRILDVTIASAMLCVLAVPMLVVALVVKLTSRGPIIYRQQRVGLNGRLFTMFKFRTMRLDAEAATGPIWSTVGDSRCTPVGSFLRRSSLDELPQLVNVLKGEMSLVGPRPERPYFVREFSQRLPHYGRRLQVPPGLTGWAQVNGWRGDTSLEARLDYDLHYVDHWSVAFNAWIILLTPFRILAQQRQAQQHES
jgi:exopolysaccharide biosynthesis polyprenyl glycosylphosphotransferase